MGYKVPEVWIWVILEANGAGSLTVSILVGLGIHASGFVMRCRRHMMTKPLLKLRLHPPQSSTERLFGLYPASSNGVVAAEVEPGPNGRPALGVRV